MRKYFSLKNYFKYYYFQVIIFKLNLHNTTHMLLVKILRKFSLLRKEEFYVTPKTSGDQFDAISGTHLSNFEVIFCSIYSYGEKQQFLLKT